MRYRVLPYKAGSRSANALAAGLRGRVLRLEGSEFRPRPDDVVINWGNTNPSTRLTGYGTQFNPPQLVRNASNKLSFFQNMDRHDETYEDIPPFWTNPEDIPDDAFPVVCRTILAGHSGAGIVISASRNDLVRAPLYVKYVRKTEEYRIHVGMSNGESPTPTVIALQRKARRQDTPDDEINWQIRNHDNGFIFQREGFTPPQGVVDAALRSLVVSGLSFGAVDVIYNLRRDKACVLEINTAPGLEGSTITDYVNYFTNFFERA